ncbi:IclR family transcriptional regulator domain-containing protein [Acidovorax sp.]|uniref:IclR family transcriptional regulator domain-containing protein n=1 Tax=Acidovorax sp. TaxID=1872122 RepID=UPI00403794BB
MTKSIGEGTGALEKALDVLEAVGAAPEGLSQTELADRLAIPRTTTYRLLATLVARGLLRRDQLRKVYCLGFRCFEMARQAYAMPDLVAAAAIELRTLRDLTGETSYLAALDGREVISLERCDGAHSQRSQAALGQRKPIHCTSQGKAILSALDEETRDALIRDLALKPLTQYTITDRRRLQAEIKVTAARGYAIDDEEIVIGVRCVGAPIVDASGRVRGAISVAGPAYRLTPDRLQLLGPELAESARRVGAQLQPAGTTLSDGAAEPVPGHWAFHGAYPLWDTRHQCLYWADRLAPAVHCTLDGTDSVQASFDQPISALVHYEETVCAVVGQTLVAIGPDGATHPVSQQIPLGLKALCDESGGTLWAAVEQSGSTVIGQLQPDGGVRVHWRVSETVQCLKWRTEDATLFAAAPDTGSILVLKPGTPTVRRLATVPKGSGLVSGLAFDGEGGIWTCLSGGWGVVRFASDGGLDRVVGLPVPCPTDLAFDGQFSQLFVATARQPVLLEVLNDAPLSGRLFRILSSGTS